MESHPIDFSFFHLFIVSFLSSLKMGQRVRGLFQISSTYLWTTSSVTDAIKQDGPYSRKKPIGLETMVTHLLSVYLGVSIRVK